MENMEVKPKDYTFPKESHSNSMFHLTREHLELLVIWSHCHGNQCTFAPIWRDIVEEHQHGVVAILWECEAGHSYNWWAGGVCQSPCDRDKSKGQLSAKPKHLDNDLKTPGQIRKTHRTKTKDNDLAKGTNSFDGSCKPFQPNNVKAAQNGASVSQPLSTHHSWRETVFFGDRGKLGLTGTSGKTSTGSGPGVVYIKTEKEETTDFNKQCEIKDENRSQNRELNKYQLSNNSLVAGQLSGRYASSTDICNMSNGCRKRSSSFTDDQCSDPSLMAHCNNSKVQVAEQHNSSHPVSRESYLIENTMKLSDISAEHYCIGSTKLTNRDPVDGPELQCDNPVLGQEGVLEFLLAILKANVVDEIYSNARLGNETDVEVLTENFSGKIAVLLNPVIQTNAQVYFSAGGWTAVSATLEVLGEALDRCKSGRDTENSITEDLEPDLMIMNPYSYNILNATAMDEEQIVVAHVPALLPSADDKKRKVKYPVTKGEIRRRIGGGVGCA
ncbi:uncharacterized protein LOC144597759 isoform X2 [Rhinoraja longicauda]